MQKMRNQNLFSAVERGALGYDSKHQRAKPKAYFAARKKIIRC
jgi:hypothetical protein